MPVPGIGASLGYRGQSRASGPVSGIGANLLLAGSHPGPWIVSPLHHRNISPRQLEYLTQHPQIVSHPITGLSYPNHWIVSPRIVPPGVPSSPSPYVAVSIMSIDVTGADAYVTNVAKRMPFHFGNVSVEAVGVLFLSLEVEVDGKTETGLSQGGLGPLWYYKDPDMAPHEGSEHMLDLTEHAWTAAIEHDPAPTVFDLWHDLYEEQYDWGDSTPYPPLLLGFGLSLVEAALVDAFCRATDRTFAEAVRENTLGIEPGRVYEELAGADPAAYLPEAPVRETALRHTVGQTDPLMPGDISPADRLEDGLPQSLAEYLETDGVSHFKIKLSADPAQDRAQLRSIRNVLASHGVEEYAITVDANEQYETVEAFRSQWQSHREAAEVRAIIDNLLYVEQPLPRDEAFTEQTREAFADWPDRPPVIIDESDDRIDTLGTALDYGYDGTSHKNVKGIMTGVINGCLLESRRRKNPDREYVLSGEDMTNVGPVELQQDLAVMATLGLEHVERNGHHYNRGLSMFPEDVQSAVLSAHGDLFRRHEDGFATVDVRDGRIRLGSVVDAAFGRGLDFNISRFTPVDEWDPRSVYG